MLHARFKGETFGLAVAEFSLRNKPVITYAGSHDRAHEMMLERDAFYYKNPTELNLIFHNLEQYFGKQNLSRDWNKYRNYSPEKVMEKFKKVFLDGK
jgi:CDP-glycerol glycerophosphotransferase (TagB/SpsB family)